MTTTSEIMTAAALNVTFEHVPSTYDPRDKESFQGIKWRATLQTPRGSFSTDYTQGIGHIPKAWGLVSEYGRGFSISQLEALRATLAKGRRHIIGNSGHMIPTKEPIPTPDPLDVLGCLFSDASATDSTFEDWCGDLGYDTDSRKALATYEACRQTGLDLLRVLGAEHFEQLRDALNEEGL